MGNRYSSQEISRIEDLTEEGLTNKEIASELDRSEAGIRNIRYRLKLVADTKEKLPTLLEEKNHLYKELEELLRKQTVMSLQIKEIETRRDQISTLLSLDEESLKLRLTNMLTELKREKPELFHISGEEQIGQIVGHVIKWLFT